MFVKRRLRSQQDGECPIHNDLEPVPGSKKGLPLEHTQGVEVKRRGFQGYDEV